MIKLWKVGVVRIFVISLVINVPRTFVKFSHDERFD